MTRASRGLAFTAALAALALCAVAANAGQAMSTANNIVSRNATDGGGTRSTTANNQLTGAIAEEIALTTAATANNVLRAGFDEIAFYPGTILAADPLTASADVTTSSATLTWGNAGYDGNVGVALGGSAYLLQIASVNTLGVLTSLQNIALTISTSAQAVGLVVGSGVTALDPNTTYYAQVFLRDNDANVSGTFTTAFTTFTTLAAAPTAGALEFLSVQQTSVTVAWIAPYSLAASSRSNEGYILQASSNNFGALGPAGAPVFSSTTFSAQASTLTVGAGGTPLDLSNTYYFQVASLNWAGQPNTATFTKLNFQILQSTVIFHLGAMDPNVARSTVSTSSMVVTNVGNYPATLQLSASTATAGGSPWILGTVAGVETPVLMGVFNSGALGPAPAAFNTFLTGSTVTATASNYAGNQTAVQIPPGATRTLWIYFTLPSQSVSLGPETMSVSTHPTFP